VDRRRFDADPDLYRHQNDADSHNTARLAYLVKVLAQKLPGKRKST
jgi:hypothetical protein